MCVCVSLPVCVCVCAGFPIHHSFSSVCVNVCLSKYWRSHKSLCALYAHDIVWMPNLLTNTGAAHFYMFDFCYVVVVVDATMHKFTDSFCYPVEYSMILLFRIDIFFGFLFFFFRMEIFDLSFQLFAKDANLNKNVWQCFVCVCVPFCCCQPRSSKSFGILSKSKKINHKTFKLRAKWSV